MEPDDLDLHFYPVIALPDSERDDWRRIVLSAIADIGGALTIVFVQEPAGWVLEGFLWAAPGEGFVPLARGRSLPLRSRIVTALRAAGKPIRTP